jgi:hypothetical protein
LQSEFAPHFAWSRQGAHTGPPQSTSLSVPFFVPSPQVAGVHRPREQKPPEQSAPVLHALPSLQAGQLPPQSLSVSVPFLTASEQVGGAQTRLVHTFEVQSVGTEHPFPSAHGLHAVPPQSTPVSLPFSI